jgi:hypothetical protein
MGSFRTVRRGRLEHAVDQLELLPMIFMILPSAIVASQGQAVAFVKAKPLLFSAMSPLIWAAASFP